MSQSVSFYKIKLQLVLSLVVALLFLFLFPFSTHALIRPFGGQVSAPVPCIGGGVWTVVGPPVGGPYVWFPGTRTYLYGPPAHPGQWLLGNAGPVGFCVVSIVPPIVFEGGTMIILGSSI